MSGKRSTIRSKNIRWREGRHGKRGRWRLARSAKPRPILDAGLAIVTAFGAAGLVACFALSLVAYRIPAYVPFGALMSLIGIAGFVFGPRDRAGYIQAAIIGILCVVGTWALFVARDDLRAPISRHAHVAHHNPAERS